MSSPFTLGHLSVWHHKAESSPSGPRPKLLLLHGISEHSGRHMNTVNWMLQQGVDVIRFDFRGAGMSGGRAQWIASFNDYVEDVITVFLWMQRNLERAPIFVLGHSLGGAVAIHFASHYSSQIDGLILSAPAYQPGSNIPGWKIALGKALVRFLPTLRMPSVGDHSALSRDPQVGELYAKDPLSFHHNTLQQGNEILKALQELPRLCQSIRTPTWIAHGTSDRVILHQGSFTLLKNLAAGDKELHFLPGGYHEPHNDTNKADYFKLLTLWLDRQRARIEQSGTQERSRPPSRGRQGISSMPSS